MGHWEDKNVMLMTMIMPILGFLADGGLDPWQPQVSGNRYQLLAITSVVNCLTEILADVKNDKNGNQ
jgi:hypothetical protein